jgi:uncharacterized protein (TIGR00725 family)
MSENSSSGGRERRPVVGVLGGGADPLPAATAERCRALGALLARRGCHLLTGGGRGVMAEVTRAFVATPSRAGLALAVLPGDAASGEPPSGYPNPWVELAIRTHLPARGQHGADPDSRNHLNVLTADALIALAGGPGTRSELELAVRYGKPVCAFAEEVERELPGCPEEVARVAGLETLEAWLADALGAGTER